jgi:predicted enzyme related to lactoylglutathione lyase
MDIPTVGRIAIIQDPTGGMVSLVKYVPMEVPEG